jgi:geranylgeranyl diphosphate synthase type II
MTEEKRKEKIESALEKYMQVDASLANPVRDAMSYALMAGGKRIRPQLMLLTYSAFALKNAQSDKAEILPEEVVTAFASALEMIHTYSLIHDDLPAMDDDSLRRGKPTVHVAFGEDIAILAGDGLLNLAYEVAAGAMEMVPGNRRIEKAMYFLARRPGLYGMLGGQTADVTLAGKKLSDEQLEFIYAYKTAALLECAMQIGAVLGGASEEELEKIRKAAYDVGIAFQVQDDILDETGDAATLGKEVGQDARNEKTTYVTLHGMEAAEAYVKEKTDQAESLLRGIFNEENTAAEELIAILQGLVGRKN